MFYQDIELLDAKDRDMLIMSNLTDVQFMLRAGQEQEALERIDAIKTMMIHTKELIVPPNGPEYPNKGGGVLHEKPKARAMGGRGETDRFLSCNE